MRVGVLKQILPENSIILSTSVVQADGILYLMIIKEFFAI